MSEQTKVGIVTGGGRRWGMGWQIALGLANKGLDVAIADIREDWGKEAAETIKAETGRRVIFVKTDVSKRDSVQAMAAQGDCGIRPCGRARQRRRDRSESAGRGFHRRACSTAL